MKRFIHYSAVALTVASLVYFFLGTIKKDREPASAGAGGVTAGNEYQIGAATLNQRTSSISDRKIPPAIDASKAVLTSDAAAILEPFKCSAVNFVQIMRKHFPIEPLGRGDKSEAVIQELRQIYQLSGSKSPSEFVAEGRVDAMFGLVIYLNHMLKHDTPREERQLFCRVVDTLITMIAENPGEQMYTNILGQIFADSWVGWGHAMGKDEATALTIWHSSDIYRHLAEGRPAESQPILVRIRYMNPK